MSKRETSKFIALILRHKPEVIGIALDEHGWADVGELVRHVVCLRIVEGGTPSEKGVQPHRS